MEIKKEKSNVFKIVLLGDLEVGKSILREYYFGYNDRITSFEEQGSAFAIKRVKTEELHVVFQIWDLRSEEDYDEIRPYLYRNVKGAFIVFDVTNKPSFHNLPKWLEELWRNAGKVPMVICGNRKDLREGKDPNEITLPEYGKVYCKKIREKTGIDVLYIETSEETGENLDEAFVFLAEAIHKPIDAENRNEKNAS
ncbi:MAG: GTP-binding protein [Asgard group archaeon]|nr:GTP-binding protein [Asgard group archaeon]